MKDKMTKIKGYQTQHIQIEVWKSDVLKEAITILKDEFELRDVDGVDETGEMYEYAEYATSHSWSTKESRGKATEQQKKALEAIKLIREMARI